MVIAMQRRTALKAVGASVLAGVAVSGTATADSDEPRIVDVDSTISAGDPDEKPAYSVTYGEDGLVEITGGVTVSEGCYEAEVDGIESTAFGDVVQVSPVRQDGFCTQVISRLEFEVTVQYADEPADVFVQIDD